MNAFILCNCGKWISILNPCEMNDHAEHYKPSDHIEMKWLAFPIKREKEEK